MLPEEARALDLIRSGNDFEDSGWVENARACYKAAVELVPQMPKAHLNLGNLLLRMGNVAGALSAYDRALEIEPTYAPAHYNRGNLLCQLRRFDEALISYEAAIAHCPDFCDAFIGIGNALSEKNEFGKAAHVYRRALAMEPNYARVHYNLGNALQRLRDPVAVHAYRKAVELDPNLGGAIAQAYLLDGQRAEWKRRSADEEALVDLINSGAEDIPPMVTLIMEAAGYGLPELQLRAARQFAKGQYGTLIDSAKPVVMTDDVDATRLRVGYISADFRQHAVMHLVEGVIVGHDASRVAVTCYSTGRTTDTVTERIRQGCERFVDVSNLSDVDAAKIIRDDGIHILVDLQGFTTDARVEVVARRPAPIIVNWIGYPATVGHPKLADYIVADRVVVPESHERFFSESLALMPDSYIPTDNRWELGHPPARADEGLPEDGVVFCSFNQAVKLNPKTFDLWCRILAAVPDSVLWLLDENKEATENLIREASAREVDQRRLIFARRVSPTDHFDRLQLADLALDTFPYVSHTTASDALWAGVPIITKAGEAFASRVAASLLEATGLSDLIVSNDQQYYDLCTSLALDRERLKRLQQKVRDTRANTPAFDTSRFTRNLERLYRLMWDSYKLGHKGTIS